MPDRRPLFRIQDARLVEALVSPARQEVVDALQAFGPCSIAALAESLGRAPDSLYYHVRKLKRVGLVVQRGSRGAGVRAEVLYDVPGRLALDFEPATPRERKSLVKLVGAILRMAERDLRAALDAGRAIYRRTSRRNAWGARMKGWISREELAEVREHLEAVVRILSDGRKRPRAGLHAVTFVLAPLAPSARARPARTSEEEAS